MGIRSALSVLMYILLLQYCAVSQAAVQGHVIDSSQNPIVGALVTFTDESNPANSFSGYTDADGWYEIEITSPPVIEDPPVEFQLGQNYPNPFNPSTTIPFSLDVPSHVSLTIYNITGQKITTVIDNTMDAGNHTTGWNGMDDDGNHVSSGVYLYRLKAGKHTKTRKMLLLDGGGASGSDMSSRPGASYPTGTAKIDVETTYTITITHGSMYPYEETGVTVADEQFKDFIVSVIGGTFEVNGFTFTAIPGGTFQMGDEVGDLPDICRPVHEVTVSDFDMSVYEITNAQYAEFLTAKIASGEITGSSYFKETVGHKFPYYSSDSPNTIYYDYKDNDFYVSSGRENHPAIKVTWYGAKAFAEHYGFDLPTEAEWEYACRGGKQYLYGTEDGTIDSTKVRYIFKGKDSYSHWRDNVIDVGSYPANPFGLYDMSGNANEWCRNTYRDYSNSSSDNSDEVFLVAPAVIRGGDCFDRKYECRSAYRNIELNKHDGHHIPNSWSTVVGFRVVRRPGGIKGRIVFNGSGLEDVVITMDESIRITDTDGAFSFKSLPKGTYTISFARVGYTFNPSSIEVCVNDSEVKSPDVIASELVHGALPTGLRFASIPGGTFQMGDEVGDLGDQCRPVHTVTVSDFEMSVCEITNLQYAEYLTMALASNDIQWNGRCIQGKTGKWKWQYYVCLKDNEGRSRNDIRYDDGKFSVRPGMDKCPVTLYWDGAKAFAEYFGCDIPTEAEWEYACRGGKQYLNGTDDGTLDRTKANYDSIYGRKCIVGSFPPNPFGLYDMSGNVAELCHDWYASYTSGEQTNPTGPKIGDEHVVRGGDYSDDSEYCRAAFRRGSFGNGFRVVRRPGGIKGRVLFNGSGLMDVAVTMQDEITHTDSDGMFSFDSLHKGSYTLSFTKVGYTFSPASRAVNVNDREVRISDVFASELVHGALPTGLTFAAIPGGTFKMGDEVGNLDYYGRPVHTVTVSDFEMSACEITNAQYADFLTLALASGDIEWDGRYMQDKTGRWEKMNYIELCDNNGKSNNLITYKNGIISVSKVLNINR